MEELGGEGVTVRHDGRRLEGRESRRGQNRRRQREAAADLISKGVKAKGKEDASYFLGFVFFFNF